MYWRPPQLGPTVAVLASGPSMNQGVADSVKHLPRIAVNLTARLAPDAQIVYGSDSPFWSTYPEMLSHPGEKVCVEQRMGMYPNVPQGVKVLRNLGLEGLSKGGGIYVGDNSGYAAINLAAAAGAKRILLLGMDMQGGHWHGPHQGLGNPQPHQFQRWMRRMNRLAVWLKEAGIEVINCSPVSALECFRKMDLVDAIADARTLD